MTKEEFKKYRKSIDKTQKQMAQLLGVSVKAVHSYEQGWRTVPPSAERQIFFLLSQKIGSRKPARNCWEIRNCPESTRAECPAWEFDAGKLCWFINGTICDGSIQKNWKEKMKICRSCDIFKNLARI